MTSVKTNIAYNFAYQVLILALPLITAPYLSRVIGANGVGTYSYSYAIATYFVYIVMLGLNNYGNRTIAASSTRGERSRAFWSIYAMQAACFVIAAIAYVVYIVFAAEDKIVASLQGIYVLSSLFDINWFFFGAEQFKLTVIRNTAVKLITVALVFLLVKSASDVALYIGIMAAGTLLSQIVLWPFLKRFVDFYRPSIRDIIPHIKPNAILFVSVIAISVYNNLSRIILGYIAGTEAVGYFENAVKIVSVPTSLVSAVGTVLLPRTSALLAEGRQSEAESHIDKTMTCMMAFAAVATFGIPCIAESFATVFYGPGFEETAQVLVVLSATIPLLAFGNVMRTQYLIPKGKDNVFLLSAACGALASVFVNILLVPHFGSIGAAFASVSAEAAVLACQLLCVKKTFPVWKYLAVSSVYILCGGVMAFALQYTPHPANDIANTFTTIMMGLLIYLPLSGACTFVILKRAKKASLSKDGRHQA